MYASVASKMPRGLALVKNGFLYLKMQILPGRRSAIYGGACRRYCQGKVADRPAGRSALKNARFTAPKGHLLS